jgi:hypothetical protein
MRSRSTSARPTNTASIKRPALVPVSAHGSASDRKLRLGVHDLLDDGEQVESTTGEAVNARHRYHVAGGEVFEHVETLAAVVVCPRHLLAINLCATRAA